MLDVSVYNGYNGQFYSVHATADWLYVGAILSTAAYPTALSVDGRGLFRMRKEPGATPEPLVPLEQSTLSHVFHSDEDHVYYLDWDKIIYWEETGDDELPALKTIELDSAEYLMLGGDDDSVWAYGNSCTRISWAFKGSPEVNVVSPPGSWRAGGAFGITSDGSTLYCTGLQEDSRPVLYAVDKASGETWDVTITHEGNNNHLMAHPGYYDSGALWMIMEPYYFGSLDVETGAFTTVSEDYQWQKTQVLREPEGRFLYWVSTNVWRYDTFDNTYVPLVNRRLDVRARAATDEDYVYFSTGDDILNRPNDPIGLVRVKKP